MTWHTIAEHQHGVITRRQLCAAGLSDEVVDGLIVGAHLWAVAPGVFVAGGAPVTYEAELWIAVLSTRGVIGFATAAHLWDLAERPDAVDVVLGTQRRVTPRPGVKRHHVFVPRSATTELRGLPVTTREWTLLDHLGRLPYPTALRLADRGLQRNWITREMLARRLRDYPGRRGNTTIRRLLVATGDGAAAESERRLHRLLRAAGLAAWRANHPVRVGGRIVAVVDVAFVGARLAIEIDGLAFHSDVDRFQHDRQRQNSLVALGWTVLRFTWWDLVERPEHVVGLIAAQLGKS